MSWESKDRQEMNKVSVERQKENQQTKKQRFKRDDQEMEAEKRNQTGRIQKLVPPYTLQVKFSIVKALRNGKRHYSNTGGYSSR